MYSKCTLITGSLRAITMYRLTRSINGTIDHPFLFVSSVFYRDLLTVVSIECHSSQISTLESRPFPFRPPSLDEDLG